VHQLVNLVERKKETGWPTKYEAEILAAFFSGAVMGWFLYEAFLLAST